MQTALTGNHIITDFKDILQTANEFLFIIASINFIWPVIAREVLHMLNSILRSFSNEVITCLLLKYTEGQTGATWKTRITGG